MQFNQSEILSCPMNKEDTSLVMPRVVSPSYSPSQNTPQLLCVNPNNIGPQASLLFAMNHNFMGTVSPDQVRFDPNGTNFVNPPSDNFHLPRSQICASHVSQQRKSQQQQSTQVNLWGFAIVDCHQPFLSRIPIAPSAIAENTVATTNYNTDVMESSTQPCASRVCYAFSETGKCEFGAQCPAFHIRWDYSSISRSLREPLCCALHNCFYSHEMIHKNCVPHVTNRHFILSLDNEQTANAGTPRAISVSPLHFSLTIGLGLLPSKENYCRFSQKRCICRLHLEGRCKWTKDCGRVHICRTLLAFLQCEEVISFLKASQSQNETSYSLYQRISQSNRIQAYIRSVVVLPLIKQFIDTSNTKVLMALIAGRCAATVEQALVLQGAGLLKQLSEVQVTPVSALIQPLLIPKMFVVA